MKTKAKEKKHIHKFQFAKDCDTDDYWETGHFGNFLFVCECGKYKYVRPKS